MAEPSSSRSHDTRMKIKYWDHLAMTVKLQNISSNLDKENRVENDLDGTNSGIVKRLKRRYEEIANSRNSNVDVQPRTTNEVTGAIENNNGVEKNVGIKDEKVESVLAQSQVCAHDEFVYAKSRFAVYTDVESTCNEELEKRKKNTNIKRDRFDAKDPIQNLRLAINTAQEGKKFSEVRMPKIAISPIKLVSKEEEEFDIRQAIRNHRLASLTVQEPSNAVQSRLTPIDAPPMPSVLEKVKVQHRSSVSTECRNVNSITAILGRTLRDEFFGVSEKDKFIELEMQKGQYRSNVSNGFYTRNITPEQRTIIMKFLVHLNAHSFYPSCFLYQTVKIFDAVLDATRVNVKELQLIALASMWIALKREHLTCSIPSAQQMISFAKDLYAGCTDLLLECEINILKVLNFDLVFPDPFSILCYHIAMSNRARFLSDDSQREMAYYCGSYMIDLALFDENLIKISPVLLTATAAETALYIVMNDKNKTGAEPAWSMWRTSDTAKRFTEVEISNVREKLLEMIAESSIRHTACDVVFKKYSRTRYGKISNFLGNIVRQLIVAE